MFVSQSGASVHPFICWHSILSYFFTIRSASASSQSNGLESLGLADIRILVRLMTLAVAGRAHSCAERQPGLKGATAASVAERNNSSCLSFLSSAIGSVVSHSPAAYRQLVEICTQVCHSTADPLTQDRAHSHITFIKAGPVL